MTNCDQRREIGICAVGHLSGLIKLGVLDGYPDLKKMSQELIDRFDATFLDSALADEGRAKALQRAQEVQAESAAAGGRTAP